MANATSFPDPWGYEKLVGDNSTDIFDAAVSTWRESGSNQIAMDLTWGFIPIMLMAVIYIRFRRIDAMMFVGLISTYGLASFNLITTYTSTVLYTLIILGSGVSLAYKLFNKRDY